jgi:hypothetical protein
VTLYRKAVSFREAVRMIFEPRHLQYAFHPNIPDLEMTVNLRNLSAQAALRLLIRQAAVEVPGITSSRGSDIFVIRTGRQMPTEQERLAADGEVVLDAKNARFVDAVHAVMDGSDLETSFLEELDDKPVTLRIDRAPRRTALYRLMRLAAEHVPNLNVTGSWKSGWVIGKYIPPAR